MFCLNLHFLSCYKNTFFFKDQADLKYIKSKKNELEYKEEEKDLL